MRFRAITTFVWTLRGIRCWLKIRRLITDFAFAGLRLFKMGLDATNKWPGETQREWGRPIVKDPEVTARIDAGFGMSWLL